MSILLHELGSGEDLVAILRRCGTRGAPALRPYVEAEISIELVDVGDLVPLSNYVLQQQLDYLTSLRERLLPSGADIHDLHGRLVWLEDGEKRAVAPPVVEYWENEGLLLVDGLHRVWLARDRDLSRVRCVVIHGVTAPLVPLPTSWDRIKVFPRGQTPSTHEKRFYRFEDVSSLKTAIPNFADRVTDQNYRYFLFRNLDELGSSGVREVDSES